MKVAGIAGGVGTTVVATVLGAQDYGREVSVSTNVIVARNDYRSMKNLNDAFNRRAFRSSALILVIMEDDRALNEDDVRSCTARMGNRVATIPASRAIARADDAGLLTEASHGAVARFVEQLRTALDWADIK